MASTIATNRLRKELLKIQQDPPPGILAEPKESDILTWYYALRGPSETPFEGGIYIGKIKFPSDYPMKAPDIYMLTPSGRFETNKTLCLSMSSFHPESWSPTWSVSSIIQGIQSFMASEEMTTGGMEASEADRRKFAANSVAYNAKHYPQLFNGNVQEAFVAADDARRTAEAKALSVAAAVSVATTGSTQRGPITKDRPPPVPTPSSDKTLPSSKTGGGNDDELSVSILSPEEAERRRKKNAKKREKLKAKKGAAANDAGPVG